MASLVNNSAYSKVGSFATLQIFYTDHFLELCFSTDTCYKSLSARLVWSHLRLRLRQKRIQAIGHKNNFFLTMFDFGIFVELCLSLFLEIVCRKKPNDELGKENQE